MTENGQEFEPIVIIGMERTHHLRIQWRKASIATEELWDFEEKGSLSFSDLLNLKWNIFVHIESGWKSKKVCMQVLARY